MPTGACVSAALATTDVCPRGPNVGRTWSHACSPFGLACVLTPDVTYTSRDVAIHWVDASGTYVWCAAGCGISTAAPAPIFP